jgi:class 3 adenylate cyclase
VLLIISINKSNTALEKTNEKVIEQKKELARQARELATEKNKAEELLLNILPKQIAEELKQHQKARTRRYDSVSVLFCDFVGFSTVAAFIPPEDIVRELNECFMAFDDICERNKMEKIKTIGDAYMCAGGIPVENHTHALDAVRAGIEMQDFVEGRKIVKQMRGEFFLELRVGIHTGSLVAGVVGKKKFAYDIWGDTVNLAARMEAGGETGKVNISEATWLLVKDFYPCEYRGEIEVKNKGKVAMYFVERPSSNS